MPRKAAATPSAPAIGLDLGGTKLAACRLGPDRTPEDLRSVPTPREYEAMVAAAADLLRAIAGEDPLPEAIGVGVPGIAHEGGDRIQAINLPWMTGHPFASDLSQALGCRILVENDANLFALSEATGGAAEGHDPVLCLTLGTGIGCGIVANGRILRGARGAAGEAGQIHHPRGLVTIEQMLSGPALERRLLDALGEPVKATEGAARAAAGDAAALRVISAWVERLAEALADLVTLLDPAVIVLGGGLIRMQGVLAAVTDRMAPLLYVPEAPPPILAAQFGPEGGARGAALLPLLQAAP